MPAVSPLDDTAPFHAISAPEPTHAGLAERYGALLRSLDAARNEASLLRVVEAWESVRREQTTWENLTRLRFSQDTRQAESRAANERLNALAPTLAAHEAAVKRALLAHPLHDLLRGRYGEQAAARWQCDVEAYDPALEPFLLRESTLEDEYTALTAQASFEFEGERMNLSTIVRYGESPDRALRERAARARWAFFGEHRAAFDRIYDDLVRVRTEMARAVGLSDFVPLAYRRLRRTDYGPAKAARYRSAIRTAIVPLAARLAEAQTRNLGLNELHVWDEGVYDTARAPRPPQSVNAVLDAALPAFAAIDPRIGAFARRLAEGSYLDLDAREGKAGGGYCTSFPTAGMPYVFANFNGTTHDVNVLVHETGHAFQCYESRHQPLSDYLWPTFEACEVHSMSMEFFAWPQLERFFGADAQRYRVAHLRSSLAFLPYGAAVDEFQHFVYEHPGASADERHAAWRELERIYLPWRRNGGIEHLEHGGYWQHQRHVYQYPFYYLDYTLALCCALQFWSRSLDDYAGALEAYVALCGRGGTLPFVALVRSAGLQSPFEDGAVEQVAERAERYLHEARAL